MRIDARGVTVLAVAALLTAAVLLSPVRAAGGDGLSGKEKRRSSA